MDISPMLLLYKYKASVEVNIYFVRNSEEKEMNGNCWNAHQRHFQVSVMATGDIDWIMTRSGLSPNEKPLRGGRR